MKSELNILDPIQRVLRVPELLVDVCYFMVQLPTRNISPQISYSHVPKR